MKEKSKKTGNRKEELLLRRAQVQKELNRRQNIGFSGPAGLPAGSFERGQTEFNAAQDNEDKKKELMAELGRIDEKLEKK